MAHGRKGGEHRSRLRRFSATLEYQARVKSAERGERLPPTLNLQWKLPTADIPLLEAQASLKKALGTTPVVNCVVIENRKMTRVRMFWTDDAKTYFFVREYKASGLIQKSTLFSSRQQALRYFAMPHGVSYVESFSAYP